MSNITYKQAMSHNRKLKNKFYKDELTVEEYIEAKIHITDLVGNDLKTDENLPARFKAYFHVRNPNGLGAQMSDDMKYGFSNVYAKYHYRSLMQMGRKIRPSASEVRWCVEGLKSELKKTKEVA